MAKITGAMMSTSAYSTAPPRRRERLRQWWTDQVFTQDWSKISIVLGFLIVIAAIQFADKDTHLLSPPPRLTVDLVDAVPEWLCSIIMVLAAARQIYCGWKKSDHCQHQAAQIASGVCAMVTFFVLLTGRVSWASFVLPLLTLTGAVVLFALEMIDANPEC